MYIVITVLIIVVCVLLSLVVLIQNPKGGGLSSTFGGVGQQILGARRSSDVVEKATWTLAVLLLVFSVGSAFFIDKRAATKTETKTEKSEVESQLGNQPLGGGLPGGLNTPTGTEGQANPAPADQQPAAPATQP